MKKIAYLLIALTTMVFTFTSCSDVPMPYEQPSIYDDPANNAVPKGDGTLSDPFNPAKANEVANALSDKETSAEAYYIKGIVCQIKSNFGEGSYTKTADFYISETGTTEDAQFYVYACKYEGNTDYTSGDKLSIGDEVTIYGYLYKYGTTPETAQNKAYIYEWKKGGSGGGGGSDVIKKVTVAEFNAAEVENDTWYEMTGTVKNLKDGDIYGNFDLEDATGSVYVYGLLAEKGGEKKKFQELVAKYGIANGSTITIRANRGDYQGKIEAMNAYIVPTGEGGDTPTPTPSGSNLITNGDFEAWESNLPVNWKSTSSAGNATLTQSTDARNGSYSVSVGFNTTSNKRMAYKELNLKAGTYTFTFYAKSTTADKSQTEAGYVPITNGTAGSYKYGSYVSLNNTSWTEVSTTFTLDAATTVCLVMMNPKTSSYAVAQDILVDDASLTTTDGGIAEGGDEGGSGGGDTGSTYTLATTFSAGTYVIAANNNGTYEVATPLTGNYGYIQKADVTPSNNKITTDAANEFIFTAVDGGYTIQAGGKYYYMQGTYNSFNVSAELPSSGYVWSVTMNSDNTVTITNVEKQKTIQYDTQYNSYGAYDTTKGVFPSLFKK